MVVQFATRIRSLRRPRVAGHLHDPAPSPAEVAALHADLAAANVTIDGLRRQLTEAREVLAEEKRLTRQLRTALALAPFAQRASLWFPLLGLWRLP